MKKENLPKIKVFNPIIEYNILFDAKKINCKAAL